MCFDVMYVSGLPFAVSISRTLTFRSGKVLANRKAETLLGSLKRIKETYAPRRLIANKVVAVNEFRTLESALLAE